MDLQRFKEQTSKYTIGAGTNSIAAESMALGDGAGNLNAYGVCEYYPEDKGCFHNLDNHSFEQKKTTIIFGSSRLGARDCRLEVFGQFFLVHSIKLKEASEFFFRFLDAPDKKDMSRVTGFKYDWKTVLDIEDDYGDWHLEAVMDDIEYPGLELYSKFQGAQRHIFYSLLCVFYGLPYDVWSVGDFAKLVELADYYCALPILSRSINGLCLHCDRLPILLRESPLELLQLSAKLRHRTLFEESIRLVLQKPLSSDLIDQISAIEDPKVRRVVKRAHRGLVSRIMGLIETLADFRLRQEEMGIFRYSVLLEKFTRPFESFIETGYGLPSIFRPLYTKDWHIPVVSIRFYLIGLLENHSKIAYCGRTVGEGRLKDLFLCVTLKDDELPWDTRASDW